MNTKSFKTVSLIMIIWGVFAFVGSFGAISGGTLDTVSTILLILNNILMIVAGFIATMAIKKGDTDKAPLCIKLGYALLAIAVISFVIGIVNTRDVSAMGIPAGAAMGIAVIGGIVSMILPLLYFLGAKKFGQNQ